MGALLAALAIIATVCAFDYHRASSPLPDPKDTASSKVQDQDGFPSVDWDYWKSVNPDIVGWVTVPGTQIDYPIVHAPADDPHFYLTHDIYGSWNYMGCPYLDAECQNLDSPECVIFGHNLGRGDISMFAQFADYSDAAFAREHKTVLLQTPTWKKFLSVQCASIIPGSDPVKRTEFCSPADLANWYSGIFWDSDMRLSDSPTVTGPLYTFCTCSYNFWAQNERTLVLAE